MNGRHRFSKQIPGKGFLGEKHSGSIQSLACVNTHMQRMPRSTGSTPRRALGTRPSSEHRRRVGGEEVELWKLKDRAWAGIMVYGRLRDVRFSSAYWRILNQGATSLDPSYREETLEGSLENELAQRENTGDQSEARRCQQVLHS